MSDVVMRTPCNNWRRARLTNTTDNGFPSKVPTKTMPAGVGDNAAQGTAASVHMLGTNHPNVYNSWAMKFYGVGSNNNTFLARLVGWTYCKGVLVNNQDSFFDPTDLFEVTVTLTSSVTGPAGGVIDTTNLFADTIVLTANTANAGVNINIVSPANDRAGYLIVDFIGFDFLEPIFSTGASATSCNALMRGM